MTRPCAGATGQNRAARLHDGDGQLQELLAGHGASAAGIQGTHECRESTRCNGYRAPQLFASPKPGEKPKSDKRKGASRKEYGIEQLRMTVQDLQHVMRNLGEPLTEDQVVDMASARR